MAIARSLRPTKSNKSKPTDGELYGNDGANRHKIDRKQQAVRRSVESAEAASILLDNISIQGLDKPPTDPQRLPLITPRTKLADKRKWIPRDDSGHSISVRIGGSESEIRPGASNVGRLQPEELNISPTISNAANGGSGVDSLALQAPARMTRAPTQPTGAAVANEFVDGLLDRNQALGEQIEYAHMSNPDQVLQELYRQMRYDYEISPDDITVSVLNLLFQSQRCSRLTAMDSWQSFQGTDAIDHIHTLLIYSHQQ